MLNLEQSAANAYPALQRGKTDHLTAFFAKLATMMIVIDYCIMFPSLQNVPSNQAKQFVHRCQKASDECHLRALIG